MKAELRKDVHLTDIPDPDQIRNSEAWLVEAARKGNQDAFRELVLRYEQRLVRVIRRFVVDQDIAEDIAQDTFLHVFQRFHQFDPSRRFGPWMFRIGVNLALDWQRRRKRRIWTFLFSDRSSGYGGDRSPDPVAVDTRPATDLREEVRMVIQKIPEKYRTVLILRDLENFSTSEIAAILHRQEATIRWRLAEARTRFQTLWEQRLEGGRMKDEG